MKTRLRMLIAEDNTAEALILQHAFKHVEVAFHRIVGDGAEAIDYLEHRGNYSDQRLHKTPNCLLIDLHMPRIDGFELLQWVADNPQHKTTPRIVLTGDRNPKNIQRAYSLGANTLFIKRNGLEHTTELIRSIGNYWLQAQLCEPPGH